MVPSVVRRFLAGCAVVAFVEPLAAQGVQAPPLTVHAIWGSREYASDLVDITWMKDGKAYTAIDQDASGNTDLYQVDALTGTKQLLVRGADLVPPGGGKPIVIEEYRFSGDGSKLLLFTNSARVWRQNTKGTFYVWDLAGKRIVPVSARPGYQQFAKFSPDGRMVGFVRDNNLYVTDLATGAETALTTDGGENVINGTSDWVYEEELDLLLADAASGATRVIMSDSDLVSVDANRPRWITGGKQFLLLSERDGYDQVYLFNRDGSLVRRVTPGGWDVFDVVGVDEQSKVLYFTGAIDGPLARPLLRIGLDGKSLTRISTEPGTHGVQFDPTFRLYVDTYSRAGVPPVETLRRSDGTLVRSVAGNLALVRKVDALRLRAPEFLKVPTPDGVSLNAWIIKPRDFDPAKHYPLLLFVYGGPGSQTVTDVWGGAQYLWHQMFAQDGYLVASVDNRGTGGRGAKFMKLTYLHLGRYESADQIAAARWFGQQPFVSADRIGIWGWSYGGYMTSRTVFLGGGVFKAALAVAPVTDWRFYDTIYTERYMRTPQENPTGYDESASLTYADSLRSSFLLVHGTGDDNVHFQNSERLVERLEAANKQFDMRIYPNKTHAITGGNTRENLYGLFTSWLKAHL